jgi:hypothetical protein
MIAALGSKVVIEWAEGGGVGRDMSAFLGSSGMMRLVADMA